MRCSAICTTYNRSLGQRHQKMMQKFELVYVTINDTGAILCLIACNRRLVLSLYHYCAVKYFAYTL